LRPSGITVPAKKVLNRKAAAVNAERSNTALNF
jgi:hypothetical protein